MYQRSSDTLCVQRFLPSPSGEWRGGFPLPSRLGGVGDRRKLPQAENEFGALWSCQKATGGNHFEYSAVHVLH